MPLELTRLLKKYCIVNSIEAWYRDLDKVTKAKVIRTGKLSTSEDNFYPDVSYDE